MPIQEVDSRIAAAKARQSGVPVAAKRTDDTTVPADAGQELAVSIPGQRGGFKMVVQDGTEPLVPPRLTMSGQINATVPSARSFESIKAEIVERASRPPKPADQKNMDFKADKNYFECEVGSLILRTTHLVGFERALTRDACDWQIVDTDGFVENTTHGVLCLIIAELRAMAEKKAQAAK